MLGIFQTDFAPVEEFIVDPYIDLPLGLGISKAVIYLWIAAALTMLVTVYIVRRGLRVRPDGKQTTVEYVYELAEQQIAKQGLPEEGMRLWFPYVAALFVFIWISNVIGFIPLPFGTHHKVHVFGLDVPQFQIYAATANLSVTLALTLVTVLATHFEGVRRHGPIKYLKTWLPAGTPAFAAPLVFVIEVISQFVRI